MDNNLKNEIENLRCEISEKRHYVVDIDSHTNGNEQGEQK